MTDVVLKEGEQNALAEQALADFAAHEGIALEGVGSGAATTKTMGPETPAA